MFMCQADAVSYWSTMDVMLAAGFWQKTLRLLQAMIQKDLARYVLGPERLHEATALCETVSALIF